MGIINRMIDEQKNKLDVLIIDNDFDLQNDQVQKQSKKIDKLMDVIQQLKQVKMK